MKQSRNSLCPCGSGKKYKRCCLEGDGAAESERLRTERPGQVRPGFHITQRGWSELLAFWNKKSAFDKMRDEIEAEQVEEGINEQN